MIILDYACDNCKNQLPNIDGWNTACKAYPEGIPVEYYKDVDPSKLRECGNGYHYEPKDNETVKGRI